ncbi:PP2C family protein-serine/threonine phosphatase [Desertivibrio insolitus]|uniref:PP2C family protein-serine/threonine phosphatase n=1 Tax=Herbiconiux sp. SYSU D00978 TaxID=2812562 RepID=UPI001A97987F|nr:SpoIIE family protein phosphatase [Herbiconiux sp. SYSU D00978]
MTTLHWMCSLAALCLLIPIYLTSYRRTRYPYTLWWSGTLLLTFLAHSFFLLDGPVTGMWAVPLANAFVVMTLAAARCSVRALRTGHSRKRLVVVTGALTLIASATHTPDHPLWSGEAVGLAALTVVLALTAVELWQLELRLGGTKLFVLASVGFSLFFAARFAGVLVDATDGGTFTPRLDDPVSTFLEFVLLILATTHMFTVSHDQHAEVAQRKLLRSDATEAEAIQRKAERTRAQLDEAARVQTRLMPHKAPDLPGYEVAGACIPSGQGSGDFFDWQRTGCGLTVTIGDVMGKGMGAAMIAATMRAALRAGVAQSSTTSLIRSIDTVIEPDLAVNDSFVTLFHAQLSPEDGRLDIIDAGHGLGLVVRADGTRTRILGGNLPLGVLPEQDWMSREQHLDVGDVLLVFSDGLLDLFDGRDDQFERAVHAALTEGRSPNDIVKAVRRLARGRQLTDDVTVVAVRRTAPVPARRATTTPDAELTAAS